ncbi:hypothetical protein I6H88_06740 [Elizabethkingia bruuniana]|uniref:Uncharacterized protein n=1 Tax=Elizabethkingia bruuniana TaxID=1756149 RepID=A0A7T7V1R1_9FLAO|nr:hypothetical protein [Elizabethkingia bruuniana]KGO08823.1 hypothetical protein KS04_18150 [Elizabethkingia miricola]MDV3605003.1 hypothetical protein [Elizabethkingia anophelis]AQX86093.1 hypothetical protein AYC65_14260 [Elizabethkingia bruuniana]KUY27250.1 hypothetical protein ATB97_19355 [Elizabethkingia bruuniana]OPB65736.1 hypothetical protein BAY12_14950 [Elizabethkingia bruuniana]
MSKTFKNVFAAAAVTIFAVHKNLDEIFVTSDGQGFTDEEKAKDQARYLKNKDVKKFIRGFEDSFIDDEQEAGSKKAEDESGGERPALVEKYTELFGKPPHHMIGVDKLKAAIADKEAEQVKGGNPPQE